MGKKEQSGGSGWSPPSEDFETGSSPVSSDSWSPPSDDFDEQPATDPFAPAPFAPSSPSESPDWRLVSTPQSEAGPTPTTQAKTYEFPAEENVDTSQAIKFGEPVEKTRQADLLAKPEAREKMDEIRDFSMRFGDLDLDGVQRKKEGLKAKARQLRGMEVGLKADFDRLTQTGEQILARRKEVEDAFAAGDPNAQSMLDAFEQDRSDHNAMVADAEKQYDAMQALAKSAERDQRFAVLREYEIKAKEGTPAGAFYNSMLNGIGTMTAGTQGIIADAIVAIAPLEYLTNDPNETKDQVAKRVKRTILADMRSAPVEMVGAEGTTNEYVDRIMKEEGVGAALLGAAESIPAIAVPGGVGFMMQASDGAMQEMEGPEFDGVPEWKKRIFSSTYGALMGKLENLGFKNLANATPIGRKLFMDAIQSIPAGASEEVVRKTLKNSIEAGASRYMTTTALGALAEFETGSIQGVADIAMKDIFNVMEGKDLFKTPEGFNNYVAEVFKQGALEAVGGAFFAQPFAMKNAIKGKGLGATATDQQFETVEKLMKDSEFAKSFEEWSALQQEAGAVTATEVEDTKASFATARKVREKIPDNLPTIIRREAFDILMELDRLSKLDKNLVPEGRVEELNARLQKVAGTKTEENGQAATGSSEAESTPSPASDRVGGGVAGTEAPGSMGPSAEGTGENGERIPGSVPGLDGAAIPVQSEVQGGDREVVQGTGSGGDEVPVGISAETPSGIQEQDGDRAAVQAQTDPVPEAGVQVQEPEQPRISRRQLQQERARIVSDSYNLSEQELGPRGAVVRYLAGGGRVNTESLIRELGLRDPRTGKTGAEFRSKVWAHEKKSPSIERVAEKIAESSGLDESEVRNELIDALRSSLGRNSLTEELRTYLPLTQEEIENDYYNQALDDDILESIGASEEEADAVRQVYADAEAEWQAMSDAEKQAIFDEYDASTQADTEAVTGADSQPERNDVARIEEGASARQNAEAEWSAEFERLRADSIAKQKARDNARQGFVKRAGNLFDGKKDGKTPGIFEGDGDTRANSAEDLKAFLKPYNDAADKAISLVDEHVRGKEKFITDRVDAAASQIQIDAIDDEQGVLNQIVGQDGASRLEDAESVLGSLEVAKRMSEQQFPPLSIKLATGWEKGVDGDWVYEVPDAEVKSPKKLAEALINGRLTEGPTRLDHWLSAPAIFKAYPQLRGATLEIVNGPFGYEAAWDPIKNRLLLNAWKFSEQYAGVGAEQALRSTSDLRGLRRLVAHELAHAVQFAEGLPQGGNIGSLSWVPQDRGDALRMAEFAKQRLESDMLDKATRASITDRVAILERMLSAPQWLSDPEDRYRYMAGEVQARAVQSSFGMSDTDRRNRLLSQMEGVHPDQQIILKRSLQIAHSNSGIDHIDKVGKALSKVAPGVRFVLHEDPIRWVETAQENGLYDNNATGFYNASTKEVHIATYKAKSNTLFHEAAHPVLAAAVINNDALLDDLYEQLKGMPDFAKYKKFGRQYPGERLQKIEAIVEFMADVATGKVAQSALPQSMYQRFKRWLMDLMRRLGFSPNTLKLDPANLRKFTDGFAKAMRDGLVVDIQKAPMDALVSSESPRNSTVLMQEDVDRLVDGWYSRLDQAVAAKGNTQSGADWMKWAEARAKEGALSMEEVKWTGLEEFLQGKAKVTPKEVRDFLKENRVKVEVRQLGDASLAIEALAYKMRGTGYSVEQDPDGDANYIQYTDTGEEWIDYDDLPENVKEIVKSQQAIVGGATKFSQYQLPGGTNYREVLVTLPSNAPVHPGHAEIERLLPEMQAARRAGDYDRANQIDARIMQLGRDIEAAGARNSTGQENLFRSSHFDEPNILVHLRLNDRVVPDPATAQMQAERAKMEKERNALGPRIAELNRQMKEESIPRDERIRMEVMTELKEGKFRNVTEARKEIEERQFAADSVPTPKWEERRALEEQWSDYNRRISALPKPRDQKVLFIEELQSDWGQQGKKKGFRKEGQQGRYNELVDGGMAPFEAMRQVEEELGAGSTPQAPFVTSTDAWVELGLKQAIRMAVEGGYDRIAWTTGEQQNERYDLSKQVDRVEWTTEVEDMGDGNTVSKHIDIKMPGGRNTMLSVRPDGTVYGGGNAQMQDKSLDEVIGKDLADKIMSQESGDLSGDGLKIGGSGMKGFYDKILPTVAKKLSKKLGGDGVVDEVAIQVAPRPKSLAWMFDWAEQAHPGMSRSDVAKAWSMGLEHPVTREFMAFSEPKSQQSIAITPEMRRKVERGVPLMQRSQEYSPKQVATMMARKGMSRSQAESYLSSKGVADDRAAEIMKAFDEGTQGEFEFGNEPEMPADEVQAIFDKQEADVKAARKDFSKRVLDTYVTAFEDSKGVAKMLLKSAGATEAVVKLNLASGAGEAAKEVYTDKRKEIHGGLNITEIKVLNNLVQARRTISIDNRYDGILAPRKKHPGGMNKESAQRWMDALKSRHPQLYAKLNDRATKYFVAMRELLDLKFKEGLVSEEVYEKLKNDEYSPREFIDHLLDAEGRVTMGTTDIGGNGVKRLADGATHSLLNNTEFLLAAQVGSTYKLMFRNRANKALYDFAVQEADNSIAYVLENEAEEPRTGFQAIGHFSDGELKRVAVVNEIATPWLVDNPILSGVNTNIVRIASLGAFKRMIITGLNPVFALVNPIRDIGHVLMFTNTYSSNLPVALGQLASDVVGKIKYNPEKGTGLSALEWSSVLKDAFTRKGRFRKYILEEGGGMDTLTRQGRPLQDGMDLYESNDWMRAMKRGSDSLFTYVGYVNETSEMIIRLAIREREIKSLTDEYKSKNEGRNPDEKADLWIRQQAAEKARAQMDFNQGGKWSKFLDAFVPYTNATLQGTRVMVRYMKENRKLFAYKFAQLGSFAMAVTAYNLMFPDEYEEIEEEVKNNNFVFLLPGLTRIDERGRKRMKYATIPKTQDQRWICTGFESAYEYFATGKFPSKRAIMSFWESVPYDWDMVTMADMPAMDAYISYMSGFDRYRQRQVADRDPGVEDWLEYTEDTPPIYRDIGKMFTTGTDEMGNPTGGLSPDGLKLAAEKGLGLSEKNPFFILLSKPWNMVAELVDGKSRGEYEKGMSEQLNDLMKPFYGRYVKETNPRAATEVVKRYSRMEETRKEIILRDMKDLVSKYGRSETPERKKAVLNEAQQYVEGLGTDDRERAVKLFEEGVKKGGISLDLVLLKGENSKLRERIFFEIYNEASETERSVLRESAVKMGFFQGREYPGGPPAFFQAIEEEVARRKKQAGSVKK